MEKIPWYKKPAKDKISTLTNLAYIVYGIMLWKYSLAVSAMFNMLGVASAGFHYTRNDCWHKFDIIAIFYAFGSLAGLAWLGIYGALFGIVIAAFLHAMYDDFIKPIKRIVIGILGALCLIPLLIHSVPFIAIAEILGVFLFAFYVSTLAESKIEEKNNIVYDSLHGVWHIASAHGMYKIAIAILTFII